LGAQHQMNINVSLPGPWIVDMWQCGMRRAESGDRNDNAV
jgi:hypothetical protein